MLNVKKQYVLLGILLIIFISGFFIFQDSDIIANLFLIDSRATSQNMALSATISGSAEEELTIPASGEIQSTDSMISQTIPKITGFTNHENDKVKIRVYTNDTTPKGFTAPSTTQITTILKYINITLDTTLTNTATIFFNISNSDLGSIDSDDIRLYRYDLDWTELTTTVEDSTNDSVSFSATTISFSNFLIGETTGVVVTPPAQSTGGPSHGGITISGPEKIPKPAVVPILPAKITKVIEEKVKKVAEVVVKEPSKIEIWLYSILPLTIIGLTILGLLYSLIIPTVSKKLKELMLKSIWIISFAIVLSFIFTKEILYWAILPLTIIGLTILGLLYYLIKQIIHRKLTSHALWITSLIIILSVIVTNEIFYWAILPLSIIIILASSFYFLVLEKVYKKLRDYLDIKKIIKAFSTKTYLILLLLIAFVTGLLLIARSGFITGYTILPTNTKINWIPTTIFVILLGMGLFYFKNLRKK